MGHVSFLSMEGWRKSTIAIGLLGMLLLGACQTTNQKQAQNQSTFEQSGVETNAAAVDFTTLQPGSDAWQLYDIGMKISEDMTPAQAGLLGFEPIPHEKHLILSGLNPGEGLRKFIDDDDEVYEKIIFSTDSADFLFMYVAFEREKYKSFEIYVSTMNEKETDDMIEIAVETYKQRSVKSFEKMIESGRITATDGEVKNLDKRIGELINKIKNNLLRKNSDKPGFYYFQPGVNYVSSNNFS